MVGDRERAVESLGAGAGMVVAHRVGRYRVPHRRHQRQAVQAADAWTLRQRVHRRAPAPGTVGRRSDAPRARARQRVAGRGRRDQVHDLRARCSHRQDQVGAGGAEGQTLWRPAPEEHLRLGDPVHRRRAALRIVRPERRALLLHARRQATLEEALAAAAHLSRLRDGLVADGARRPRLPAARQRGRFVHHRARRQDG